MPDLLDDHLHFTSDGEAWCLATDRTWWGHEALFGGYAQAMVLAAMQTELDRSGRGDAKPVRSLTMHFMRPFQDGEHQVSVELIREGRSMANLTARAEQGGALMGYALANFGTERDIPTSNYTELALPEVAALAPDEQPVEVGVGVPTHDLFDLFPRVGSYGFARAETGPQQARAGGWVRPRFAATVDERYLTVLADLWLPATYQRWEAPLVAVSVDITLHFRAPVPGDLEPGTPLLVLVQTARSGRGVVDEDCEVWSPAGDLLLQGRQTRFVTEIPSPGFSPAG